MPDEVANLRRENIYKALVQYAGSFLLSILDDKIDFLHGRIEKIEFHQPFRSLNNKLEEESFQLRILTSNGTTEETNQSWIALRNASDRAFALMLEILIGRRITDAAEKLSTKFQDTSFEEFSSTDFQSALIEELLETAFWRAISIFKQKALRAEKIKKRVIEELEKCNNPFFVELGKNLNQQNESTSSHQFNAITFVMAQFWVMPNFPLWMMNNEAGSRFVGYILGEDVASENYAKIIERCGLPRFGRFPIRGIKVDRNGRFMGFELSRWAEGKV